MIKKKIHLVETHRFLREAWCSVLSESTKFDFHVRAVGSAQAMERLLSAVVPDLLVLGGESDGFNRKNILELISRCSALGVFVLLCSIDDEWNSLIPKDALCAFIPKTVDLVAFLSAAESPFAD